MTYVWSLLGGEMEQLKPVLYVTMLGKFSLTYMDRQISFKTHTTTKSLKLLQILLYSTAANGGISRTQLLEDLYQQEELCDISNNLRVTIHRLKKLLLQAGLPEYDYILVENGIYRWNSSFPIKIDAVEFETLVKSAQAESDPKIQADLYDQACSLYRGVFLPALVEDDWAIVNSVKYKKLYELAFLQLCDYLKCNREYEKILDIATSAIQIYPFEEWQAIKIDALMALNRYKEAEQYYEETSKMLFEELGASPSEKMMKLFEEMSIKMGRTRRTTNEIKEVLAIVDHQSGAFYCNLPSFRDNYRLIRRLIDRTGLSVQVMICSLTDGYGHPLENKERLEVLSENLHKAIRSSLRRSDCFTRYSPSQFLILLIGATPESCQMIYKRIVNHFSREHKSWKKYMEYSVFSASEKKCS